MEIKRIIKSQVDFLQIYLNGNPPPPKTFFYNNKKYKVEYLSDDGNLNATIKNIDENSYVNPDYFKNKIITWKFKNFNYLDDYISGDLSFLTKLNSYKYGRVLIFQGNEFLIKLVIDSSEDKIDDFYIKVFDNMIDNKTKHLFYEKYGNSHKWVKKYLIYKIRKIFKNK